MPYVKLDDNYADHPKVTRLSDAAFRLHTSAIIRSGRYLTDGRIEFDDVPRLVPKFRKQAVDELLDKGLWEQNGTGYLIHDYLDWNPSRTQVERAKKAAARRKAQWRRQQGEEPEEE